MINDTQDQINNGGGTGSTNTGNEPSKRKKKNSGLRNRKFPQDRTRSAAEPFANKQKTVEKPTIVEQPRKKRKRNKSASFRKLYEVDNRDLPQGIPVITAFLPEWPVAMPQKGLEPDSIRKPILEKPIEQPAKKTLPAIQPIQRKQKSAQQENNLTRESIEEEILSYLKRVAVPVEAEQIFEEIGAPASEVRNTLHLLMTAGKIFLSKKHKVALPEQLGYHVGKLQVNARGFGFVSCENEEKETYVSQDNRKGALNNDIVVIKILEDSLHGDSKEGEVVQIQTHANTHIVGTIIKEASGQFLRPDNARCDTNFPIQKGGLKGAKNGQKVFAAISYGHQMASAKVIEILGYPNEKGIDVLAIIRDHNIETEFPASVRKSAKKFPQTVHQDDIARREDMRAMTTVTIDGETAKDFDDAISCEKLENGGYLLGVHIADVAHYVQENTVIDKEAYDRATSVYFVDRVIPMLPEELSNGLCSLNPKEDRLTISCIMEFDAFGNQVSHRITEAVIRSRNRLVYKNVNSLLSGVKSWRNRYKTLVPILENMEKLAELLEAQRVKRGSIDFDIPEAEIILDEEGKTKKIQLRERGISEKIIESFMLACNETVAKHMQLLDRPMMYRVHETPEIEKMQELSDFLTGYGLVLRWDKQQIHPKALQGIMKKIEGKPYEAVISRVLLRSLKRARYSDENLGHFGLAAKYYAHFTSPIRRYPDLLVHRMLKETLKGKQDDQRVQSLRTRLPEMSQHCSDQERVAMEAERDVDDLKKAEYMAEFVGKTFPGTISGITNFGIFVELENTCEGLIRLQELTDDYYVVDEKKHQVVGRNFHKVYALGGSVEVKVENVDVSLRRVDFSFVETKQLLQTKKRKRNNSKNKKAR